jgi:hypothetical protein
MVEAPATTFPRCSFFCIAFWIASQSKPSWSRNFASSAATTARFRCSEMRAYGTQWYFSLAPGLAARIDSSLCCMKALDEGLNSLQ